MQILYKGTQLVSSFPTENVKIISIQYSGDRPCPAQTAGFGKALRKLTLPEAVSASAPLGPLPFSRKPCSNYSSLGLFHTYSCWGRGELMLVVLIKAKGPGMYSLGQL